MSELTDLVAFQKCAIEFADLFLSILNNRHLAFLLFRPSLVQNQARFTH